jgi:plasmid stability protein
MVLTIRNWPDDLHRKLRVTALQRGETLRALMIRAAEQELERIERGEDET